MASAFIVCFHTTLRRYVLSIYNPKKVQIYLGDNIAIVNDKNLVTADMPYPPVRVLGLIVYTNSTEGFRRIGVDVLRRPSVEFIAEHSLLVTLINQVHHHLDFVELVNADFVFLLLARQNKSKLLFCSCFVRRFGIAHASMALRSLNHNLDHHIFSCSLYNLNSLKLITASCEVSNCSAPE